MRGWLAGALAPVLAVASAGVEHLAPPADPSMRLGYANDRAAPIREWVPRGETVAAWTRMVTVQRLSWRPGLTPRRFGERLLSGIAAACPGATVALADAPLPDGRAAADVRFDCPRNPATGLPEAMRGRIVAGGVEMHMAQAAARRAFSAADEAWARGVLDGMGLCAATSQEARCRATAAATVGEPL